MTLKMPSSVRVGSRSPRSFLIFSYSSEVSPCCRRSSGEMAGVMEVVMGSLYCRILEALKEAEFGDDGVDEAVYFPRTTNQFVKANTIVATRIRDWPKSTRVTR